MAESAGGAVSIPDVHRGLPQVPWEPERLKAGVAVAIGTDPATTFAAIVPAPPGSKSSSSPFPARQAGRDCEMRDSRPGSPAHAEIVLEGYVELK